MEVGPNPECVPSPVGAELRVLGRPSPTAWGHLQRSLCDCNTHEKGAKRAWPRAWKPKRTIPPRLGTRPWLKYSALQGFSCLLRFLLLGAGRESSPQLLAADVGDTDITGKTP